MRHLLEFTGDGNRVVVQGAGGLSIVDVRGTAPPRDLAIAELHAFAAVGDQLWAVAGDPPVLTAYTREGVALASVPVSSLGTTTRLHHASNSLSASWQGSPITTIAFGNTLQATERAPDVDWRLGKSNRENPRLPV